MFPEIYICKVILVDLTLRMPDEISAAAVPLFPFQCNVRFAFNA